MAATAVMSLTACQADMDTPALQDPQSPIQANISILDFKNEFANRTEQIGTKENGDHYIVHGRVVSSDASGNIYKSLVIQDETAALSFSLNRASLYNEYRLGQEMVVDLTGLYNGYYGGLQQIGWLGLYNGEEQVTFLNFDYWLNNSYYQGLPDPAFKNVALNSDYPDNEMYCIVMEDFEQISTATLPQIQSQLVEFRNVHFQIDPGEETYGYYEVTTDRTLVDKNGAKILVPISGYSNFYNQEMPTGTGRVRGILSYFENNDIKWQFLIRDLNDVMISDKGTESEPYTIAELQSGDYDSMQGWSKGYIVGSAKLGVSQIKSNDDVIFGAGAETETNLLIAASADVRDVDECAIVQLPQGTMIRQAVNLYDNPQMLGKELMVYGTNGNYLGLPGVIGTPGGRDDFLIDGESPFAPLPAPAPEGDGTENNPFNVSAAMQTDTELSGVWVYGYVAGYIDADTREDFSDSTAVFSAEDNGSSFIENNIILSGVEPFRCGVGNSIPCQIPAKFRSELSLKSNPDIFGRKIKVKCNVQFGYWGTVAIRSISEVVEL